MDDASAREDVRGEEHGPAVLPGVGFLLIDGTPMPGAAAAPRPACLVRRRVLVGEEAFRRTVAEHDRIVAGAPEAFRDILRHGRPCTREGELRGERGDGTLEVALPGEHGITYLVRVPRDEVEFP